MISFLVWFIGVVLAIQMISAWFGVIDYWYRWQRYRLRVITAIVGWTGLFLLVAALLPTHLVASFEYGFWTVLTMTVLLLLIGPLLLPLYQSNVRKKYQIFLSQINARKPPGDS